MKFVVGLDMFPSQMGMEILFASKQAVDLVAPLDENTAQNIE